MSKHEQSRYQRDPKVEAARRNARSRAIREQNERGAKV